MLFYGVITFLCAVLCIPLRIYMELQCIDPFTGFYEGGTALRWLYVLLVGAAILCLLLPKRESRRNVKPVSGRICLLPAGILLALSAAASAWSPLGQLLVQVWNKTGASLLIGTVVCLVAAAVSSLVFGGLFFFGRSRQNGFQPLLLLAPVLWILQLLIQRFSQFTALSSISDQKIFVAFLVFSCLFLLFHARAVGGVDPDRGRRWSVPLGYGVFLLGAPLAAGIAAVRFAGIGAYPTLSDVDLLLVASMALYALVYSYTVSREQYLVEQSGRMLHRE